MPPKKATPKSNPAPSPSKHPEVPTTNATAPKTSKRKPPPTRTSPDRKSRRTRSHQPPSPQTLLPHLLTAHARALSHPKDETDLSATTKTYTGSVPLSPFEELLSAIILSRPISHALGQRTICTIFNDPYNFTTPAAIRAAGEEKVHQALWDARTQHKAKTAQQIVSLADTLVDKFGEDAGAVGLEKVREEGEGDINVLREAVQNGFKGIGRTGVDIFLRRAQAWWPECYPFVDGRTSASLEKLGLPVDAEELRGLVEERLGKGGLEGLEGKTTEDKRRLAFVVCAERAVACDLEGRVDELVGSVV